MRSWQNMTAESFGMGLSSSGRWTLHLQRFQAFVGWLLRFYGLVLVSLIMPIRKEHHSWALRFRSLRGCTQYLSMNSERNNTVNNVQLSSTQFMLLLWLLDLMQMWPTASMHLPDGYQRHITGNTKCNLQVGGS
ncbi:uncharacterized protein LOC119987121 isoform X12 [Tripterygium wilfordii]|uniref:uncharacterized protein LOC119987121 isoform X12 n=1 Tax=Tripterygium wilfordii TaxID=458696 RepID=UPI0018F7E9F2|nr:uncharacterized protein LOC119987121 isoform X12 [Tripterygium wilfordii]